jgi:hypothetical protein
MMTEAKILSAVEGLVRLLGGIAEFERIVEEDTAQQPSLERRIFHLRYMCKQIPVFLAENRREKVMRWLGFIQGAMWALGMTSIAEMKELNRPDGTENPV